MCFHFAGISRFCFIFTTPFIISTGAALIFCAGFIYLLLNNFSKKEPPGKNEFSHAEEVLRTTIEIHEQTFINIRQQIHDNIGQTLSLAKLNLNTPVSNITSEKMMLTEELVSKTIMELRDISKSLYNDVLTDFVKGIRMQVNAVSKITSLHTKFIEPHYAPTLSEEQTVILVRCVQVLLNSIVRYAKASRVTTEIISSADKLEIYIGDDGENIYYKMNEIKSILSTLQQRLQLIDAHITLETQKKKGNFARIEMAVQGS